MSAPLGVNHNYIVFFYSEKTVTSFFLWLCINYDCDNIQLSKSRGHMWPWICKVLSIENWTIGGYVFISMHRKCNSMEILSYEHSLAITADRWQRWKLKSLWKVHTLRHTQHWVTECWVSDQLILHSSNEIDWLGFLQGSCLPYM